MEMEGMTFKKLVNIKEEQKNELDEIRKQINENGGNVTVMDLINDAIGIFVDQYRDVAVLRYSPAFYKKEDE